MKKLEESLEESKQKWEESQEQLKTNENGQSTVHITVIMFDMILYLYFSSSHVCSLAVINWLNKQMNEQMLGRGPAASVPGFPRTSTQPGVPVAPSSSTLSSIRPSPSGLPSHRYLPTTASAGGLVGSAPHTQLQHRVSIRMRLLYSIWHSNVFDSTESTVFTLDCQLYYG